MKVGSYLILRGLIFGGLIFGGNFVLVNREAYIRGGLYSGFYNIYKIKIGQMKINETFLDTFL